MWEDTFKETGLPQSSFAKLAFSDGQPKVRGSMMKNLSREHQLGQDTGELGWGGAGVKSSAGRWTAHHPTACTSLIWLQHVDSHQT